MFKSMKIAGLCLASMLLVGMALAGSANAAPLWLLCLEGSASTTKYSSNQCSKVESSGKWESVALGTKSDTVNIKAFTLSLLDEGTGAEITCDGAGTVGTGLIESSNKGVTRVAEVTKPSTNCVLTKAAILGCTETKNIEEVKGANLPWATEIVANGTKLETKIKKGPGAAGEPGWKVKCGGVEDVCTSPAGEEEGVELVNLESAGVLLVKGRFEELHKANCTVGGNKKGRVRGLLAILLSKGSGLSINTQ